VGIGAFTLALDATSADSGLWGLAIARALAACVLALAVLALRLRASASNDWKRLVTAGLLDGSAMIAFVFALRTGHMALVAVVTALYPAFTVALAMLIDRERMLRTQVAGIAVAAAAIVLISWNA
jgi:drug/metabolite transporter (DMT)-like permease